MGAQAHFTFQIGNDLCNSGECVGSSSSGVEFLFDVPADYDPIEIDYTVTPPDCYGDPSFLKWIQLLVVGVQTIRKHHTLSKWMIKYTPV